MQTSIKHPEVTSSSVKNHLFSSCIRLWVIMQLSSWFSALMTLVDAVMVLQLYKVNSFLVFVSSPQLRHTQHKNEQARPAFTCQCMQWWYTVDSTV